MLKEFKKFALKGNMMDLAVGVIIGGAFNSLVSSLVNDIIMPLLSLITGKIDFTNLYVALNHKAYTALLEELGTKPTLAEAQAAGISTLSYGNFITGVINFIIMAFVVFLIVKGMNKLRELGEKPAAPAAPAAPTTKICPYCQSEIAIKAVRCPHCTSELKEEA